MGGLSGAVVIYYLFVYTSFLDILYRNWNGFFLRRFGYITWFVCCLKIYLFVKLHWGHWCRRAFGTMSLDSLSS